jgi:tetratricopeptide (TPR) repeat protein
MEFFKKVVVLFTVILLITSLQKTSGQELSEVISAFQQSYIHEASGDFQESMEVLRKVYDEKSYEINLRLGWLAYLSGLFSESIAFYNKAISLMPYSIEARFGIVYPASALGNWNMVINHYNKILEINPNNSVATHRLGLIYYGREDYEEAYRYFEKVVNLYPFDYDALIMFAWTNYKLNKTREAKILFQKALMHTPGGASALEGLELLDQ